MRLTVEISQSGTSLLTASPEILTAQHQAVMVVALWLGCPRVTAGAESKPMEPDLGHASEGSGRPTIRTPEWFPVGSRRETTDNDEILSHQT